MTDATVTLRLTANADGVVTGVRLASGEVAKLGAAGQQAGTQAAGGFGKARAGMDGFAGSAQRGNGQVRDFAAGLNSVRAALGGIGIAVVARELLNAGMEMQRMNNSLQAVTGSQTLAGREIAYLRAEAQRLGIYLPSLAQGFIALSASTRGTALEGEKTRKLFSAVAEAGRAMSLSVADMQGIFSALSQIAGKGVVSMEELRQQLGDRLPGAMQIAARSMNMTVAEFVKLVGEGGVLAEDFLPKFADGLHKAYEAGALFNANSPAAEFQRLRTELFEIGSEVADDGGVLAVLAAGAGALASALAALSGSGVLPALAKGLMVMAAAGAVFYVGGLLQRGFIALTAQIALANAPVAGLAIGLTNAAAGAQRVTLATLAAGAATRSLGAALAFVQANPIALTVTAVTLLVSWLYTSQKAAQAAAEEIRIGFATAKQALDEFNRTPSLEASFTLADAKIRESIERLRGELERLRQEKIALDQAGRHMGLREAAETSALAYRTLADEVASTERQLAALESGTNKAAAAQATLVLQAAGLSNVSPELRERLSQVSKEGILQQKTLEDMVPRWQEVIRQFGFADDAARMTADGVKTISAAVQQSTDDLEDYAKKLAGLDVRLAELKFGKAAAIGLRFKQDIDAAAKAAGQGDIDKGMVVLQQTGMLEKYVAAMNATIAKSAEVDAAENAQAEARKKNLATLRDIPKALDQARQSQQRYTDQAALAAAELRGPLALAQEQSRQKIAGLDAALGKHNITVTAHKTLVEADAAALAKQTAELQKRMGAPQALLDAMTGELTLLRQIGPERELTRRRLQAEADMRRELADAVEAAGGKEQLAARNGAASWAEYEAAMLRAAGANAQLSMQIEEQAAQAEDWARLWVDAVGSVADAFTSFVMSGLRDFKGLAKDLKSIAKQLIGDLIRTFLQQKIVIPIQTQITQSFSGSVFGSGQQGLGSLLNNGFDRLLSGFGKLFGRGGAAQSAIEAGSKAGFELARQAGVAVPAGTGAGGWMMLPNGQAIQTGAFSGMAGMGALSGAVMGWGLGGDTAGKIGGAVAGGVAGYGLMVGGGAAMAASAAGAGLMGSAAAGLAAVPVAGWVALAALAINSISGGKLFGTKFKAESGAQQFDIGQSGATGYNSITEVKQRSFFRGRKWRTTQTALDAESQAAIDQLYDALRGTVETAATRLGIDVPSIVGGTFRREFDKNGNLTREFGTIAGRVYNEAQDAFAARLVGENMLAVAKAAGSAAELERLANAYRATGEALQDFATLALAVQEDLLGANGIWKQVSGDNVMTRIVEYIKGMAKAGESLADAYARVQQAVSQYGTLIGGVRQQIATHGLNQYQKAQLEIELAYRDQVKQANDLAKALGLSGARAEDLAAIEQLRALNMADLAQQYAAQQQTQNQQWLQDLGLSDLSPLSDSQKLAQAMEQLNAAVAAGDTQRAQKLAEQALALGRGLYASGQDYNALYEQVTGLVGGLNNLTMEELQGLTNEELAGLADLVSGLPSQIAQELAALLIAPLPETAPAPTPGPTPAPAPAPVPPPPSGDGGGTGGGTSGGGGAHELPRHGNDTTQEQLMAIAAGIESVAASNQAMFALEQQRLLDELSRGTRTGR